MLGLHKRTGRRMKRDLRSLVLIDGFARRDCRILNISADGAKLAIDGKTGLPRQFDIAFAPSISARPCELVWRNGSMAGIKFVR